MAQKKSTTPRSPKRPGPTIVPRPELARPQKGPLVVPRPKLARPQKGVPIVTPLEKNKKSGIEKKRMNLKSLSKKPLKRMSVKRLDSSEVAYRNEDKAKQMTRLMRKGYRKGYRVKSTRGGSRR